MHLNIKNTLMEGCFCKNIIEVLFCKFSIFPPISLTLLLLSDASSLSSLYLSGSVGGNRSAVGTLSSLPCISPRPVSLGGRWISRLAAPGSLVQAIFFFFGRRTVFRIQQDLATGLSSSGSIIQSSLLFNLPRRRTDSVEALALILSNPRKPWHLGGTPWAVFIPNRPLANPSCHSQFTGRASTPATCPSRRLNLNLVHKMDVSMKVFQERVMELETEGEQLLLARHQVVENDRLRNGNREALTALRKRARTTKTSLPSPFESIMKDIGPRPMVKEVCTTCGDHDSEERTWMMFPGADVFARVPFHAAHTILEADQGRLDYKAKKLQGYVKEKSLLISEHGALSDKISPSVLRSLVTLTDKPK